MEIKIDRSKKISELTPYEIEERIELLQIVSLDEAICYIIHVIDIEYTLSESKKDNDAAEKFLSDKRLNKFRDGVMKHIDQQDAIASSFANGKRFSAIPRKLRKKIARKKEQEKIINMKFKNYE